MYPTARGWGSNPWCDLTCNISFPTITRSQCSLWPVSREQWDLQNPQFPPHPIPRRENRSCISETTVTGLPLISRHRPHVAQESQWKKAKTPQPERPCMKEKDCGVGVHPFDPELWEGTVRVQVTQPYQRQRSRWLERVGTWPVPCKWCKWCKWCKSTSGILALTWLN